MKRYKIWKAGLHSYRVLDRSNGALTVMHDLIALNCTTHVNTNQYIAAKERGFKDSGNPLDCFAWIDADKVVANTSRVLYPKRLLFNPFKDNKFINRVTGETILSTNIVTTVGNTLSYDKTTAANS